MKSKSLFGPHTFCAYPEGHHIKETCQKCGRGRAHELHEIVPGQPIDFDPPLRVHFTGAHPMDRVKAAAGDGGVFVRERPESPLSGVRHVLYDPLVGPRITNEELRAQQVKDERALKGVRALLKRLRG